MGSQGAVAALPRASQPCGRDRRRARCLRPVRDGTPTGRVSVADPPGTVFVVQPVVVPGLDAARDSSDSR